MKKKNLITIVLLGSVSCAAATFAQPAGPGLGQKSVQASSFPTGAGSLMGVWMNAEYKGTAKHTSRELTLRTSNGEKPPLLPAAADLLEKRLADADKGDMFASSSSQCLPGGVPAMIFGANYPIQILETPDQVTFLFEEQNHFRAIRLGGSHPKDPDPSYMGDSIGHWESDTLVVDTVALSDKTTLDQVGTPHSDALHIVERYRRIAPNKLEIRLTIDDPGVFSKPWETRGSYKPAGVGKYVREYICDNNRNVTDANGHTSFQPSGPR